MGEIRGKVINLFDSKIEGGTDIKDIHYKNVNYNVDFQEFKVDGKLKVKEIKELLEEYNYNFSDAEKNM